MPTNRPGPGPDRIHRSPRKARRRAGRRLLPWGPGPWEGLLEGRRLLATVGVTTPNDVVDGNDSSIAALIAHPGLDGKISLREAVIAANNTTATANTITLPAGTYTLTIAGDDDNAHAGDLDVTNALTIQGAGSGSTIVQAGTSASTGIDKVFSFNPLGNLPGFAVGISGLTLRYGKNDNSDNSSGEDEGGAFDFDAGYQGNFNGKGSLTMNDVVVDHNSTINGDGGGLALFDGGTINITNCQFTNNTATTLADPNGATADGGGIFFGSASGYGVAKVTGVATISNTTFSGNATHYNGTVGGTASGGGLSSLGSDDSGGDSFTLALHADTFTNNTAAQDGGGLDAAADSLTIDQGTTISGNSAGEFGGGLVTAAGFGGAAGTVTGVTIVGNTAGGTQETTATTKDVFGGGGIYNENGTLTVRDSRIAGNTATAGPNQIANHSAVANTVVDAKDNFLGTNTPAAADFAAGVTYAPYLVLKDSAAPATIGVGQTSTVTASITTNSAGTAGFYVPAGTPVTFSDPLGKGTFNPTSATTVGTTGQATSTYTAVAAGVDNKVSAAVDQATATTTITNLAAPTANSQSVTTNQDTAVAITLTGSDPNSPPRSLTYIVTTAPAHGTLSGTAPNLTYTPTPGYFGPDSFQFKDNNGALDSNVATVSITVIGKPTAEAKSVSTNQDTSVAITLTGSDPNSPPRSLTYIVTTAPAHGTLSGTAPNLTYTPTAGYTGPDSFKFKDNNGALDSNIATVSITVNPVNHAPTANNQSVSTNQNTAVAVTLTATDPDAGDTLTYAVTSAPAHGTLSGTAPNLTYTPTAGYTGPDSFKFQATDNHGAASNIATVSITVNAVNHAPTANNQSVSTNQDTAVAVTLTATDPDAGDTLTYTVTSSPAHGTLSGTAPNLTYTPTAGYTGPDSFQFKATDNHGAASNLATVSLTVVPVQATVSAVSASWGTAETATLQTNADGLRLLPAGRTTDLPWLAINKLGITLSSAAALSASDITVTGLTVANYGPVTVSGSGTSYTITLAQPITLADRVTITIGNAGITSFTRRLDVLPGDVNDDGVVNSQDAVLVRNAYLGYQGAVPTVIEDINGDAVVDVNDYNLVRQRNGTKLP